MLPDFQGGVLGGAYTVGRPSCPRGAPRVTRGDPRVPGGLLLLPSVCLVGQNIGTLLEGFASGGLYIYSF